jgi:hypothetical protein
MREVAPADPFRLVAMSSSSVVLVREISQNITLTELRDIFDQVIRILSSLATATSLTYLSKVGTIQNSYIFSHTSSMESCAFIEYSTPLEADIGEIDSVSLLSLLSS